MLFRLGARQRPCEFLSEDFSFFSKNTSAWVLGLEHSCPWPRKDLSSKVVPLVLASNLVSWTSPLNRRPTVFLGREKLSAVRFKLKNQKFTKLNMLKFNLSVSKSTKSFNFFYVKFIVQTQCFAINSIFALFLFQKNKQP